ncbi:hypothetical protein A2482_01775 [Candidatus Falkowbacteria bacterium RIFOXYC2_FULL_48_21]|uniref:DUF218 domain-containing protein n=1 Tax=Candidatus Falkowbacteria bacterium RIFOXYC2_FULL_48_21 TaxID=1798005 RepID=A0A1F5TG78_9BACT|nr:MAG: hypothetical protein A2482_01775 [Candidatus Falkowbacteria bacterium RIFOXYC2_FULL_48_21]
MTDTGSAAIIMGYGIPPDIMRDVNYRVYLNTALRQVILPRNIDYIILCGGRTNIHHPEKTEAGEMRHWLEQVLPAPGRPNIAVVGNSITGWENLEGAAALLRSRPAAEVFIVCEKTRRAKVWLTARLTLPVGTRFEVVGIDFDAGRTWIKDYKQYLGVMVVAAEHIFPGLRRITRRRQQSHIQAVSRK